MATAAVEEPGTALAGQIEEIRAALAEYSLRTGRGSLQTCDVLHARQRKFSTVVFLRVRTSRGEEQLVAKTTTPHPENSTVKGCEQQAVVEYNVLQRLFSRFQDVAHCSVPRPVLVLPALDTYVMEYVAGTLLTEQHRHARYFASGRAFAALCDCYFHSGRWLRHFQEFTGKRLSGPECAGDLLQRCDFRLQLIEQSRDRRCPGELRSVVMELLERHYARLANDRIPVAGRHGDFGPWNILTGSRGVTVLDFFGFQDDPVPIDLFSMFMALENEARCWTSSRKRLARLRQRFLDGYGPLPGVPPPLLTICETLRRVSNIGRCLVQRTKWPRRQLEDHFSMKADIAWLLAGGRGESLWPGHTTH
jgi:hypothetical protein